MSISVLMSVYIKEQPTYLDKALRSVFDQTIVPREVILVKDGPLTDELEQVISLYKEREKALKVIPLDRNVGLGEALRIGLTYCSYDLVARMDSDDICKPDRFEKQVNFLNAYPEITIVGCWIEEFVEQKEKVESRRQTPLDDQSLKSFMKWRNPFNHMTVMFRKSDVLSVGSYQPFYLLEDYYLWIRLANAGFHFANIGESLLWARGGYKMLERRGGWKYVISETKLLHFMYRSKRINFAEFLINVSTKSFVRLIGKRGRHLLYLMFLRAR